jgi:hypothetical protein
MTPVKVECHGGSWMDEDLLKSTLEFLTRDALTYVVVDEVERDRPALRVMASIQTGTFRRYL